MTYLLYTLAQCAIFIATGKRDINVVHRRGGNPIEQAALVELSAQVLEQRVGYADLARHRIGEFEHEALLEA